MIPNNLINPYNVDPKLDLPQTGEGKDNWTEYYYFFGYDRHAGIGISLHIGRLVSDLSIWRGILYAFLPNEEVLVRKYAGRDGSSQGPGAGPLRIACVDPMQLWTLDFDGVMQTVTRESLTREVPRDGVDELVRLHMIFEAAAPLAILTPSTMKGLDWSHHHFEQIYKMRGEFSYRGKTATLNGMGARDHSSGPRNSGGAVGAFWANIAFPSGKVFNVNVARTKIFEIRTGYAFWGDGSPVEEAKIISCPKVNDGETPPNSVHRDIMVEEKNFEVVVETSRGVQTLQGERLHSVASTYIPPHHEIAGTDLLRLDAAQMTKTAALFTLNGEAGIGQMDRYVRMHTLRG